METKRKNVLIGALLAVVFVMAIGYAAFAQQLTINGSASISSTWNVQISSITAGEPEGSALDEGTSIGEGGLTATFNASLTSPGDSITYTVTVHNSGTINAKLSEWNLSAGETNEDDPIVYSVQGLENEEQLSAGSDKVFYVTVTYNDSVTSQPEQNQKSKSAIISLTYNQA